MMSSQAPLNAFFMRSSKLPPVTASIWSMDNSFLPSYTSGPVTGETGPGQQGPGKKTPSFPAETGTIPYNPYVFDPSVLPDYFRIHPDGISYIGEPGVEAVHD